MAAASVVKGSANTSIAVNNIQVKPFRTLLDECVAAGAADRKIDKNAVADAYFDAYPLDKEPVGVGLYKAGSNGRSRLVPVEQARKWIMTALATRAYDLAPGQKGKMSSYQVLLAKIKQKNESILKLVTDLTELQKEVANLESQLNEKDEDLNNSQEEISGLQSDKELLEEENENLKALNQGLHDEMEAMRAAFAALTTSKRLPKK